MTNNLPALSSLNYDDPKVIAVLKDTVAKGATDAEFWMFTQMCRATGLNPIKREVWFIKTNNGIQMMTGINGFYSIANAHPHYDGQSEPEFGKDEGGLFCRVSVYRKDRQHPQTAKIYDVEFNKHYGNWKTMPRYMLSKCAEAVALRKSFPQELNGLYTVEEMPAEYSPEPIKATITEIKLKGESVPEQSVHFYALDKVDDARIEDAKALLEANNAEYDDLCRVWVSKVAVKKLARHEIDKDAAFKRAEPASDDEPDWMKAEINVSELKGAA